MDKKTVTELEQQMLEEHRKDLEALARLKRFLPSKDNMGGLETSTTITEPPSHSTITPLVPEEGTPLKHAIRDILNHDPSVKWTNSKVLKYLIDIGFELKAQKPIYSIGQATQQLISSGEIKLVKKGSGSAPSTLCGLTSLEQAARESAEARYGMTGHKKEVYKG